MEIIFVVIIILLLTMTLYQIKKKRELSTQLVYISEKLHSIIYNRSTEQLLVVTDDHEIKALLRAINELLSQ